MPLVAEHRTRSPAAVLVAAASLSGLACGGSDPELTGRAARGQAVADRAGCAACHGGVDADATVGPPWIGSWGTDVELDDGRRVTFDAEYVLRSVREPDADRRVGDWLRMPAYGPDQITDAELDDVVEYLRALGSP